MNEAQTKKLYRKAKRAARIKILNLPGIIAVQNSWVKDEWWLIPDTTEGAGDRGVINGAYWELYIYHGDSGEEGIRRHGHKVYKL